MGQDEIKAKGWKNGHRNGRSEIGGLSVLCSLVHAI